MENAYFGSASRQLQASPMQLSPGLHEKREISVVVECETIDEMYVLVQSAPVELSPETYTDNNTTIYGPCECQLLT